MNPTRTSRRARLVVVVTALCLLSSCWLPRASVSDLVTDGPPTPAAILDACAVTVMKCTRCHTVDRIRVAQVNNPRQWEVYVSRMRRMSASGITEADGPQIVQCLVYRSFGPPGLEALVRHAPLPQEDSGDPISTTD